MDEVWERAVDIALDGQADCASARSLTLDGAVKCYQGRLPPSPLLEKFENLEHLSIANVGVSSLENFPRLRNLQRLILSDNRIAGGLEFLVAAGLESLRDLDLSNNRIQSIEDLEPLARLQLVSLDLYECPVTRVMDYRSKVFGLIRSLKYLDKMDVEENERPESDEEEEDEEDDDPGSGEIDGEDRNGKISNGRRGSEGVLYVDEDEESEADEEETEAGARVGNGSNSHSNGFAVAGSNDGDEEYEDVEEEDEDDLGEEIDEEEGEDEEVVGVQEIDESGDEEDGVEEDENGEEEVDDDNEENPEPGVRRRELVSTDGEIDGHDHEEDDDENGEIGEENGEGLEDVEYEDDGEDEDDGAGFLVQPIGQVEGDSDAELDNAEDEADEDVEDGDEHDKTQLQQQQPSSSHSKRKRDGGGEDESITLFEARFEGEIRGVELYTPLMDSQHVTVGTLSIDASSTPMEVESVDPIVAPPNSSSLPSSKRK
ncbi:hypothetical protein Sjap_016892 [Stephania japonica]|uniref:Acidic leucine-rich nuclear phosphoprotein 32-related protein n=1 Tax=Stephania japonica TaxID=461633 RepID=A0AAP0NHS5_9MAGN